MKIALVSSCIPFINGGARNIVEWLEKLLVSQGHEVERVYLPQVDTPTLIMSQMMAYRLVDLSAADRVICFRPQAHLVSHPNKIVWFIHHLRQFYDLWDTEYRGMPDDAHHRALKSAVREADTRALLEAKHIYTNSQVVSDRLWKFNGIESVVVYPPIYQPERFRCDYYGEEIVYISRLAPHKRQHLLIEAMQYVRTPVKLRLCGTGDLPEYPALLRSEIRGLGLEACVVVDDRWISEKEKEDVFATCLSTAYFPLDEDSYGYPSLEASHSCKPVITTSDAGGVLELVIDGYNGIVCEPSPHSLAEAMDRLYGDRDATAAMGRNAEARLRQLNISWTHVTERMLA